MADNENIIVSRIQHRRGLKQDLPQPLRPGEIGLATDSRQVYIGGDPDDPHATQYNAVSYFENTTSAVEHTQSIVDNQMLIFQVPFVRYTMGEWNGITVSKQWNPTDARSIISETQLPASKYSSSSYPVFSPLDVADVVEPVNADVTNQVVFDIPLNTNIRIGDSVTGANVSASPVYVSNISHSDTTTTVSVTAAQTLTAGDTVTISPNTTLNYRKYIEIPNTTVDGYNIRFDQGAFTSTDVIVTKNGVRLVADPDDDNTGVPTASADYTFNGYDVRNNGTHSLTLRTPPTVRDDITVCYYDADSVALAIRGVKRDEYGEQVGYISSTSSVKSFYEEYNIPWYREIPEENILVSETTGLGYIGLQQKHIQSVADGKQLFNLTELTLGNFRVARLDQIVAGSIDIVDITGSDLIDTTGGLGGVIVEINIVNPELNVFSPDSAQNTERYKYDTVKLVYPGTGAANFFHGKAFPVSSVNGADSISIVVPRQPFDITRSVIVTDNTLSALVLDGNAVGVKVNDWIRLIGDNDPGLELHGYMFRVIECNDTYIKVDTTDYYIPGMAAPSATALNSQYLYINHGPLPTPTAAMDEATNPVQEDVVQVYAPNNTLTDSEPYVIFTSNTSTIIDTDLEPIRKAVVSYTDDTFYVRLDESVDENENVIPAPGMVPNGDMIIGSTGGYIPWLQTSYADIDLIPVLSIDLSDKPTVVEAMATVSKPLVRINAVSPTTDIQIFPLLDWLPQEDGKLNTLYFTSKPAYTSVDIGGLEFELFEDELGTMASLGLTPGVYNRNSNTVRANLEKWMNSLLESPRVNLFTNIFVGTTPYNVFANGHNFGSYSPVYDSTYNEILFGSRQEAANFNRIVNSVYAESPYDRAEDDLEGTRGLVNLKNNLEIRTREAGGIGEKLVTYTSMDRTSFSNLYDSTDTPLMAFDGTVYNTLVIDYSITESADEPNLYNRVGTLTISVRRDFNNGLLSTDPEFVKDVIVADNYSSIHKVEDSQNPGTYLDTIVEPKFYATLTSEGEILVKFEEQDLDQNTSVIHTVGSDLSIKYVVKRWDSTN